MGKKLPSISVIMPAYNEERSVESAVLHNNKTFASVGLDYELLIIDDKSTDRTREMAEIVASKNKFTRLLLHETNLGPGGAFRTGIQHATKDYVLFLPFDNPMNPEDLEAYLPRMGVCDIILGFRVKRVGYSFFGRFASFVYNRILIPMLFNIGVSDVNWIQAYRRSLFVDGIISFRNSKIFYLVEILVQARRKGLIIAEVPSRMVQRLYGKPTCTQISTMWETLCEAIGFFIKMQRERSE